MTENLKTAIIALDQAMDAACELPEQYFNEDERIDLLALSEKLHGVFLSRIAA